MDSLGAGPTSGAALPLQSPKQRGLILFGKAKGFLFCLCFVPAGQKILHHRSDVLETVVLINPSDEAVSTEVSLTTSPHTASREPAIWRLGKWGKEKRRTRFGVQEDFLTPRERLTDFNCTPLSRTSARSYCFVKTRNCEIWGTCERIAVGLRLTVIQWGR